MTVSQENYYLSSELKGLIIFACHKWRHIQRSNTVLQSSEPAVHIHNSWLGNVTNCHYVTYLTTYLEFYELAGFEIDRICKYARRYVLASVAKVKFAGFRQVPHSTRCLPQKFLLRHRYDGNQGYRRRWCNQSWGALHSEGCLELAGKSGCQDVAGKSSWWLGSQRGPLLRKKINIS